MADQAINALSTKTAPETSDQLLLVGTGEPQLIDYDKLADAILNKITSKNYALDAGTMTLPAALNALNGNHVTIVKEVKITTTEKLSYTGAEITIKENQIALLCFTNNWNDVKPDAMQISTSKTELSVSNIISPEITNYPIRYSIIFSPKIETTLYAWTRHTGENMNGIVKIEGIIFDL